MRIFLPLLCVLCATPLHGFIDGTCPRKDPPPGVLVLSPGSKLVVNCSGHVEVDGVKVSMGLNNNKRGSSADAIQTTTANVRSNPEALIKSETAKSAVSEGYRSNPTEAGENRILRHAGRGYTAPLTTHTVRPTSVSRRLKGESEEVDGEGDHEEEEEEEEEGGEGSRVTRGIKSRLQWTWNKRTVVKGDRERGDVSLERGGASLSLSSVRLTDSGRYTCYERGKERFSLKVKVADPPETPSLSCYKRSPSSKIRCEWRSQKPITTCYLLLSKSPTEAFLRFPCSYSSRLSRCWCALDHDENELRTLHMAYLCVTGIAGNATSDLLHFIPMTILKPDPPSDVSVRQEEGQETRMKVTWSLPISWKSHDNFYQLIYEIKYRPLMSSLFHGQIQVTKNCFSYTITDAMPGVEYEIQLRTREDYDGSWSDWSTPVSGSSWRAKEPVDWFNYDVTATTFQGLTEGSTDDEVADAPQSVDRPLDWEVSPLVLMIPVSFVLLLIILAAYIFRHKDRFVSKIQSLSPIAQFGDSPRRPPSAPPSAPPLPEGQALVTFAPPHYKEPPHSGVERQEEDEEDEEEEQQLKERTEAMHFNNTSYFFLHRE
ncbi:interleukin-6 receptor subunit alpha [Centropristis striata]|uniref:interleukin-6 receptor subunit alpha n=1 Tax=Centropristis striata TaxID=184440 RepID=UPI0027E0D542|nr:interleukin-6 receptor subunit alpha [Centropristis striata]